MPKLSPHRLKGKIIRIRRGLALYQTYASPYYFARILDARNQRYKVRSTKETNRVEARKVADEYAQQITSRDAPADREFSFKTYANRFVQKGLQLAQSGERNKNYIRTINTFKVRCLRRYRFFALPRRLRMSRWVMLRAPCPAST
jgi:hypothetical protein